MGGEQKRERDKVSPIHYLSQRTMGMSRTPRTAVILLLVSLAGLSISSVLADNSTYSTNGARFEEFLPDPPYAEGRILVQAERDPDGSARRGAGGSGGCHGPGGRRGCALRSGG